MNEPARALPPFKLVDFPRLCPTCAAPMRLIGVMPHATFAKIQDWTYACACGGRRTELVALPESKPPADLRVCSACGARMSVAHVEPHPSYSSLDRRIWSCGCGHTSRDSVPRSR
jgi:hypothetical protein